MISFSLVMKRWRNCVHLQICVNALFVWIFSLWSQQKPTTVWVQYFCCWASKRESSVYLLKALDCEYYSLNCVPFVNRLYYELIAKRGIISQAGSQINVRPATLSAVKSNALPEQCSVNIFLWIFLLCSPAGCSLPHSLILQFAALFKAEIVFYSLRKKDALNNK